MRVVTLEVLALLAGGVFAAMFISVFRGNTTSDRQATARQRLAVELLWAAIPCLIILAAVAPAAIDIMSASAN